MRILKEQPIGIIDSGFGGLTVVKEAIRQLPHESIIYLGDSARAPYGPRSLDEVQEFIWQMTEFLMSKQIKMLVIACNTGTAAALDYIRQKVDFPVVGVIHSGARAATKHTEKGIVGIIGTSGTINSGMYEHVIIRRDDHLKIISQACPEFVMIVENNQMNQPETMEIITQRLQPLIESEVDTLVLGCTHYPHLYSQIQEVMGQDVILIDSGVETINEVNMLLDYFEIARSAEDAKLNPPTLDLYTTGDGGTFGKFARRWLSDEDIFVEELLIAGDKIIETNYSES